jgi:hypothetical protein
MEILLAETAVFLVFVEAGYNGILDEDVGKIPIGKDEFHLIVVINCEVDLLADVCKAVERQHL